MAHEVSWGGGVGAGGATVALHNMACCYAQMGQKAAAITRLESILKSGRAATFVGL